MSNICGDCRHFASVISEEDSGSSVMGGCVNPDSISFGMAYLAERPAPPCFEDEQKEKVIRVKVEQVADEDAYKSGVLTLYGSFRIKGYAQDDIKRGEEVIVK